ncbi:amino acid ABC transporter ATP-binding protein (PAAT family) [Leucobacter komagatae]|uniref:ABC-type polar-amino-acid transporter n=1 Tax=Leucobacter komagatae TaxID=55969 RepID=A0A542Y261_9MICO|nr:amino acid ABC transporter ATP-binding protein [Leucobacter komagatae]TQL42165.1 amino acid ABC transporter ATP-binding protein (PAAT family) [Leucobacter komagatae]
MSTPVVTVRGLIKKYHDTAVLQGVDLTLDRGEVLSIIGPSGSGKSTLLRCLNQLEEVDGGEIRHGDELLGIETVRGRLMRVREKDVVRQRRAFGMVFQHFNLFPHMTALQNVMEGPTQVRRMPQADARALALEELKRVGLAGHANHYPAELSGGQQQRVAIARALAMRPEIMLFDEPTSALDPELVDEVLDVIRGLAAEGMTMVIVTHEMSLAQEISDSVVVMDRGQVVEAGPPTQIFRAPRSERTRRFVAKLIAAQQKTEEKENL